jgi:siroheme synthase-like protein
MVVADAFAIAVIRPFFPPAIELAFLVTFLYPLMLDVADRLNVIVGGGAVAHRKAEGLINAGAQRIRMVATEILPMHDAGVAIEYVKERYQSRHLEGAGLVFAASDDAGVNTAVVRDAHARGLLVCRADHNDTDPGDFSSPAVLEATPVTITVSTLGSPALAAKIRDDLHAKLDRRWVKLADAMLTLRPQVLASNAPPQQRREILRELASEAAMHAVQRGGLTELRRWILEHYPDVKL